MRLCVWLAAAGSMLALGAAACLAESAQETPEKDKPTTRPAPKAEPPGPRTAEPRRGPRAGRGEGRRGPNAPDSTETPGEAAPGRAGGAGSGPPSPGSDRPGGPMFGLSPERVERAMKFLKEQYPRQYEHLCELRERDPRAFQRQLNRIMPRIPELMNLLERNPKLARLIIDEHRLEMDIRDAAVDYGRADDEDYRATLKERIRALISKQFDVRQEKLKLMIADLERELERKKQLLSEQATKKEKMVDREMERRLEPDM